MNTPESRSAAQASWPGLRTHLDLPTTVCALESRYCSTLMSGAGGFDVHHRWPVSLGGPVHAPDELALCPNHHRRQHALIRYLIEGDMASWLVTRRFTIRERQLAMFAVGRWRESGSPPIAGWPTPPARA